MPRAADPPGREPKREPFVVRPATAQDVDEIARLDWSLWGDWANPITLYRQLIDMLPETVLVARNRHGEYAGCALGLVRPHPIAGWILSIDIPPQFQGLGLGKQLAAELLVAFRRLGVEVVTTIIDPHNEPSRRLVTSFGFKMERMEPDYFGAGKPQERWVLRSSG